MNPFKTASSIATPLDRTNVDTDQIIPKQFLKSTERTGFGKNLSKRYIEQSCIRL